MLFPTVACGKNSPSKALHIQLKFVSRAVLEMTSRYVNVPVTATPAQLRDALGACSELNPVYRRLLTMALKELQLIDQVRNKTWRQQTLHLVPGGAGVAAMRDQYEAGLLAALRESPGLGRSGSGFLL